MNENEETAIEWGVTYEAWDGTEQVNQFRTRDECQRFIDNPPMWADRRQVETSKIVSRLAATAWAPEGVSA